MCQTILAWMDEDLSSGCFLVKEKWIILFALLKKQPINFQTAKTLHIVVLP